MAVIPATLLFGGSTSPDALGRQERRFCRVPTFEVSSARRLRRFAGRTWKHPRGESWMKGELESWLLWLAPESWDTEMVAEVIDALRDGQAPQKIVKTYNVDLAGVNRLKRALETHELIAPRPVLKEMVLIQTGTAVAKFSIAAASLAWVCVVALIGLRQVQLNVAVNSGAWVAHVASSASTAEIVGAAKTSLPGGEYKAWRQTGKCVVRVEGTYQLRLPAVGPIELRSSATSCQET
jgi:hypothetical protein